MEVDSSFNATNSANVVDPEVRAFVYSLVTALGGTGADEQGRYILGDDALACLKDLKRWLKLYDEKTNRLDVARCLAEVNLVKGDLLEILASWPEEAREDRLRSKIALASLELLVPLTWPYEKDDQQMTINHHRHLPYLQLAQLNYKGAILEHRCGKILRTVVRVGLPAIALPAGERTSRDEGIIKLVLYFFRNLAMISPPPHKSVDDNCAEISRSATIQAFHEQDVFALILTIASNLGEDFNVQDVVVLELLFHLLKGIDVKKLFMTQRQKTIKNADELNSLIAKEASMHRDHAKHAPTRHNRFGTMIWVKRDDERVSTVSGQDNLLNSQLTFAKMDQSKKWKRPGQGGRAKDRDADVFDLPVTLTLSATEHLRIFIEEFLDSAFNPLFNHIRKAIEREADRVLESHSQQYFYLISWFLAAERERRKCKQAAGLRRNQKSRDVFEADSFGLVASVLSQETFILLGRFMQDRLDLKSWQDVYSGMRCFSQILLTIQDMADSSLEEDQEISENILNRVFYEETTHDQMVAILRGYKSQGFRYLDACTELSHVFLRMLERYSRENLDLQVRSKRKARKKKAPPKQQDDNAADLDSEAEEVAEAQRMSRERKFDFTRFSSKFIHQSCVNTFVAFAAYYKDLNHEQLKRVHRYFYRVAFKAEMGVMLFRVDILALFHKIVKGPDGLERANPLFKEWEELSQQLFRRLVKKMQQRPELAVELLFSKINATTYYLEYGHEKQTVASKPRAPAELEVKGSMTRHEQIGVVVAAMHKEKLDAIDFVKAALISGRDERQSWEGELEARKLLGEAPNEPVQPPSILVKPDSEPRRIALFKDAQLRLLMTLSGIERLGDEDEISTSWIIPSSITSASLQETIDIIEAHRNKPRHQYGTLDDPVTAEEMLRRKSAGTGASRKARAAYDDDSDAADFLDNEEFLFPAGGPTPRPSELAMEALKKRRLSRKRRAPDSDDEGEELDSGALAARRKARRERELEKRRKIKSDDLIHSSDEEEDEERDREFFRREEEMARMNAAKIREVLGLGKRKTDGVGENRRKKKPRTELVDGKGLADKDDEDGLAMAIPDNDDDLLGDIRSEASADETDPGSGPSDVGADSTPATSSPKIGSSQEKDAVFDGMDVDETGGEEEEERETYESGSTKANKENLVSVFGEGGAIGNAGESEDGKDDVAVKGGRRRRRVVDFSDDEG